MEKYQVKKLQLPEKYQKNILLAVDILKKAGCSDIFLFGSLAEGNIRKNSDIDLAIRGCPQEKFFSVLGQLFLVLDYTVDLVDLDSKDGFSAYLEKEGGLIKIG